MINDLSDIMINDLPEELLGNIFKIVYGTMPHINSHKLELVCKKWNRILDNRIFISIRRTCICLGPLLGYAMDCTALNHFCICLRGLHCVPVCKASKHDCSCYNMPQYLNCCRVKSTIHCKKF